MNRMAISDPIKRQLRQEAGFGCCKCGNPIFEYHHIVPDSADPMDLMILCPLCHHEATIGAMLEDEQRNNKSRPFNIRNGYVKGTLKVNQSALAISIGSNQFVGDGGIILVDQEELISITVDDEGKIELSIQLYDRNDKRLVIIEHNEWISGDPLPWDIESSFQWIKIRLKIGDIALEIDARKSPVEIRANLWRKGQNFKLNRDQIRFDGVLQNIGFSNLCFVAVRLVADTSLKAFAIEPDPRFGNGALVSWADVQERITKGLQAWEQIKNSKSGQANQMKVGSNERR